jgi:hypothetical protein
MQGTEQAVKDWRVHCLKLVTAKADNISKLKADLEADAAPYIISWQPSEEPKRGRGPTSLPVSS